MDVLIYFYIKNWTLAEHLLLQDTDFDLVIIDAENTILHKHWVQNIRSMFRIISETTRNSASISSKIHLIIFLNETQNKQWFKKNLIVYSSTF